MGLRTGALHCHRRSPQRTIQWEWLWKSYGLPVPSRWTKSKQLKLLIFKAHWWEDSNQDLPGKRLGIPQGIKDPTITSRGSRCSQALQFLWHLNKARKAGRNCDLPPKSGEFLYKTSGENTSVLRVHFPYFNILDIWELPKSCEMTGLQSSHNRFYKIGMKQLRKWEHVSKS